MLIGVFFMLLASGHGQGLAGSDAAYGGRHSTQDGEAAQCRMSILGNNNGTISNATIACNSRVSVGFSEQRLGRFAKRFEGVSWDQACMRPACLLSFCTSSHVLVSGSIIKGVSGVQHILCVSGSVNLTVQDSLISNNNATAVAAYNTSRAVVRSSTISYNTVVDAPGGLTAHDDARVLITARSRVYSNVAINSSAGGVRAVGRSHVTIAGESVISHNDCDGLDTYKLPKVSCQGGGVFVADNAIVVVEGGSRIQHNSADLKGGGISVIESGVVTVRGRSMVCNNMAIGHGGGFGVGGHAVVTVVGSVVCNNTSPNRSGGSRWRTAPV